MSELRPALVAAGLMLALPFGEKVAARFGWAGADDFTQRALMVLLAAFIVMTGNTIPKRIVSLTCRGADPGRVQACYRFAGWVWVLTGLAFGLAWIVLPSPAAGTATLIIVPLGIALTAYSWLDLRATRRPEA